MILAKGLRTHILTKEKNTQMRAVQCNVKTSGVFFMLISIFHRVERNDTKFPVHCSHLGFVLYFNERESESQRERERESRDFYRHNIRSHLCLIEYLMDL